VLLQGLDVDNANIDVDAVLEQIADTMSNFYDKEFERYASSISVQDCLHRFPSYRSLIVFSNSHPYCSLENERENPPPLPPSSLTSVDTLASTVGGGVDRVSEGAHVVSMDEFSVPALPQRVPQTEGSE